MYFIIKIIEESLKNEPVMVYYTIGSFTKVIKAFYDFNYHSNQQQTV